MKVGEFVRRWTPEEIDFLRAQNDTLTYQEIADKLGRTGPAVQTKAQEIGIRKSKEFINRKAQISQFKPGHVSVTVGRVYANAWKQHEYQYLIDNYETKTCNEIAEVLNRTPGAVKTVAGKVLKLKKSEESKRLIAKRPNKGQFSAGKHPVNTQHDFAISIRSNKDAKSKWIRIGLNKWQQLHHYNWLRAGREIPEGYVLRFIDGNPLNCEIENLQLVLRGRHSRLSQNLEMKREMAMELKQEREEKRIAQQAIIEQARAAKLQLRQSKAEARKMAQLFRMARKIQRSLEREESKQLALKLKEEARQARAEQKAKEKQERAALKPARKARRANPKVYVVARPKSKGISNSVRLSKEDRKAKRKEEREQIRLQQRIQKQEQRKAEREQIRLQQQLEKEAQRKKLELQRAAERKLASQRKERRRIEEEENKKLPTRMIDYSQLVPLKINEKTTIYIKPGQDPAQARERWLNKYASTERIQYD